MNQAHQQRSLKRDLQIVAWNAKGVFPKLEELREFLYRNKPDLLLLNETHLSPGKTVRLPNYVLHRDDRLTRPGGGTAIVGKTSILHNRVVLPPLTDPEATAVELPVITGGLLLIAAYRPPQSAVLGADFSAVFSAHRKVILAGDVNCENSAWGSRLTTRQGRLLQGIADSNSVQVIGANQPTHYPSRRGALPDVLDIAMVKGLVCPVEVFVLTELSSDHCPILVRSYPTHRRQRCAAGDRVEWLRACL